MPELVPPRHGARAVWSDFCAVAPSPELRQRLQDQLTRARSGADELAGQLAVSRAPRHLGFDDGTIFPPAEFPLGTPYTTIQAAAADRAPLRGPVRVIVVLADFSDREMTATAQHFEDLFFSLGVLPNGSVREYYREVTHGLVDIVGEVVGPLRLPQTLDWYANGNFGIGRPSGEARANIMARDAAQAADPAVDFGPYDNDANGYVDAFIVVHAGSGGEATGNSGDIWSHKWTLPGELNADGTKIFAYLTIPEDARIGVCAHELGHLLFGFPDLYDTDGTSEGVGNWCLMGAGSWGGGGDVPVHPSAWCKVNQGWAASTVVTSGGTLSFEDVKSSHTVHRLWKDGGGGSEYFLVENRQLTGYDRSLPGPGLLVWHIDEAKPGNTDENHYKVGLLQADNKRDLETAHNRGDAGDPFPGSAANTALSGSTSPSTQSYAGADTCVTLSAISAAALTMTASVSVSCGKPLAKELKDGGKERKDAGKETKEPLKERKDARKETKEPFKERKDVRKEFKEPFKERKDLKDRIEVKQFDLPVRPPEGGTADDSVAAVLADLQARLEAVEEVLAGEYGPEGGREGGYGDVGGEPAGEPFIGSALRPDLPGGPVFDAGSEALRQAMGDADPQAKRAFDTLPSQ
ncbi:MULTISPECIES: M6 family metalloprotease domain-containing protein [Kitasatospora]|uniref:Immune inhibitor A n=2 Tax=Kitasatospora TaxID=2063 RepID=A0ABT1J1H7_9ACTN|nr:M6 family metalloprotease domain-containing protein [Kitasatospora paracochleata]MCP2311271.1 immune inhibitor A [Kitasatospora paracochleata]